MTLLYWEDMPSGGKQIIGSHTFEAAPMIAFAQKYDPQSFHIDPVAAKSSPYGALIASGWYTCAIFMKLQIARAEALKASGAPRPARLGVSPGIRDLKWLKPVFAGDTLTYSAEPFDKIELKSRPDRGIVLSRAEAINQHGELAMSLVGLGLVARRTEGKT